jgi:Saf4/Yju2 protein
MFIYTYFQSRGESRFTYNASDWLLRSALPSPPFHPATLAPSAWSAIVNKCFFLFYTCLTEPGARPTTEISFALVYNTLPSYHSGQISLSLQRCLLTLTLRDIWLSLLFKMSERKVLTKYYPPDFDPSKITRTPRHLRPAEAKLPKVRLMAPFSMKCTSCGEYIYKGRKFNAQKETTDEKYLNISIFRFYIKCTRCAAEITFKTDPKNMDYTCEKGAKRNFEIWRSGKGDEIEETDEQRLDRLEREEAEAEEMEERNAMAELEQKMEDSKREMKIADALDEIRTRNARIERGEKGDIGVQEALAGVRDQVEDDRLRAEREDDEMARRAFEEGNRQKVLLEDSEKEHVNGSNKVTADEADRAAMPPPTFERVKKARKPLVPGLVKKTEASKSLPAPPPSLGLGDYGSDSD